MENFASGKVDKYDFCHALVENTINIVAKRVKARRGNDKDDLEKLEVLENSRSTQIEDDVRNMKTLIEEIKKALLDQ